MAGLKCGVLPIVPEAEELAFVSRNRAGCAIHPAQGARHQQGRRRTPTLCRQARELVDLTCLGWRLILARRAEVELARQEPSSASGYPDCSTGSHGDFLRRKTATVAPQSNTALRAGLQPVLGIILQGPGERIIYVTFRRLRHPTCSP